MSESVPSQIGGFPRQINESSHIFAENNENGHNPSIFLFHILIITMDIWFNVG